MSLDIDLVQEAREAFQKLRMSRTANHAFVLKPETDTLKITVEYEYPEGKSLDEIAEDLPSDEPRFIVIMPERVHPDGRKSYPLALICYCPQGMSPQTNIVYSNSRNTISRDFQLTHVWDVKKRSAIGDEELIEKFETNKWA